jgi:predicted nucleic acid-binding protein
VSIAIPTGNSSRILLLDTNVLLLLFVGLWDRPRIQHFKKTEQFTDDDFGLMLEILQGFGQVATTTHILTEISNLSGQHGEPERTAFFNTLAMRISLLPEHHIAAQTVIANPVFVRLGLTDTAIAAIASEAALEVLTTDAALYTHLSTIGVSVYNFNHIRQRKLLR